MAGKPNIRSIRFSDELAELIDRQAGNTFTEKFENLVTRCVWELPQKEMELKVVQKQMRREKERLAELRKRREKLDQAISDTAEIGLSFEGAGRAVTQFCGRPPGAACVGVLQYGNCRGLGPGGPVYKEW